MTNLSISSKESLSKQQIDALARGQLAFGLLPIQPFLTAAELGGPVHFEEMLDAIRCGELRHLAYLITGTFSQSFRNCSTPSSVSGCFRS